MSLREQLEDRIRALEIIVAETRATINGAMRRLKQVEQELAAARAALAEVSE